MTVKEIIQDYLKTHGYDGLVNTEGECGCGIDGMPACDNMDSGCEPAYYRDCKGCDIVASGEPCWADEPGDGCYMAKEKPLCQCNTPLIPAFVKLREGVELKPVLEPGTNKHFMKCPKCDQIYPPIKGDIVSGVGQDKPAQP